MIFEFTFILRRREDGIDITFKNEDVPTGLYGVVVDAVYTVGDYVTKEFGDELASDMLLHGKIDSTAKKFYGMSVEPMPSKDTPKH